MLKNYIKTAFRYLLRHKEYSIINILGLAVGIACCILIMLFLRSELSYDKFHAKSDRLFRLYQKETIKGEEFTSAVTPVPLAPALQASFPQIESVSRVYSFSTLVKRSDETFNEQVYMVDSLFFSMFDFKIIAGNPATMLSDQSSIVINTTLSEKYFGTQNPVGQVLQLQLGDTLQIFTVSGVIEPSPDESSIKPAFVIPFSNSNQLFSAGMQKSWFNVVLETYALLKPDTDPASLQKQLPAMVRTQLGDDFIEGNYSVFLQPITDIHLNDKIPEGNEPISNPRYSYILGTIGFLILLIACINFITLSIGRSTGRALEVGVRKVLGAERRQLIGQFWGEAMIVVGIAMLTAGLLAWLTLPFFNTISNKNLSFTFDWVAVLYALALLLFVGLIAGIYPAFILSAFKPVEALKGKMQAAVGMGFFRKGLIVSQFVASIVMIVCTLMIGKQMNYLQQKDLGFKRENVVIIPTNMPRSESQPVTDRFRQEVAKNPEVKAMSVVMFSFNEPGWAALDYTDKNKINRKMRLNAVDAEFIPAMDVELIRGRNFSADNSADLENAMIINESLAKDLGWADPIGKKLPGDFPQTIIGLVKDFHYESLHTPVQPLALVMRPDSAFRVAENIMFSASSRPRMMVRLKAGNLQSQIASLKSAWQKVAPNQDFEYVFLDESLNAQYQQEERLSTVVNVASGLSVFIACLGLFGLATLVVSRRTKEIGIRKVLGADTSTIVMLLSKDFMKLVLLATIISFPIAWWALSDWLMDFAYRVSISWWVFLLAGLGTLIIALITVSLQTIKAALTNPVNSLRSE